MQLGMIGLGRMGRSMVVRLQRAGHKCVVYDVSQEAVQSLSGAGPADPYEGYANYNLGYALYRSGRCSEAVTYLRRAEHLEPDRSEPKDLRKRAQHC